MEDVASDLISNIEGYQQLLTTLALGVSAGAFALLSQIIFHNAQNENRVLLRHTWLIFSAIGANFTSIVFGVMTKSVLVSSVPALHALKWGSDSATSYLNAAGLGNIMFWSMMQVLTFGIGMVVLFVALLLNTRLLHQR
ncbi:MULTISPECIES: hypothetical protein [unclassified Mesorhizobium]|uniref:hypothetical protein n=1 Tax=unclassified Mesorhizobium TaxID=325217 RepID=UPI000FCA540D|nr:MULTISPECIES: hypothetical protein [unclassified Mesorhizobium]RUW70902.1 hypothetical protein EOA31_19145 [Mesorhizobium sp. M4B.F.Ca.ET.049.02.1.2]TGV25026.1 hypothetical protein EN786_16435 [Mesorhizobium sp. M4B.F.Ca.ET.143.01.1.1]